MTWWNECEIERCMLVRKCIWKLPRKNAKNQKTWACPSASARHHRKIIGSNKAISSSCCVCQQAYPSALAAPVRKRMGPCETIGSSSCICQWAHMKPLAAAATYANLLAAAAAYANGPIRGHWHQKLHMPMGPHGFISSSSCICQWANMKPSASEAAYANGPIRGLWHQKWHMPMGPA